MTAARIAQATIHLHDLTLGHRDVAAVVDLDGRFEGGGMTAIHGPNGSGKTTLLEGIVGLRRPMRGSVSRTFGSRLAYLPQQHEIDRRFPISVFDLVALGTWFAIGATDRLKHDARGQVEAALESLGIDDLADRAIASLSTGQFQRALFARAIVQDADIVVLDEPFNAVDSRTTEVLLAVLQRLHAEGRTIIAVLHDVDQIRASFGQTLLLARRCIAWGGTASVLTADHLDAARHDLDHESAGTNSPRGAR